MNVLKKIQVVFNNILFKKHKYESTSIEIKNLKKMTGLKEYNKLYFSMHYNDLYRDLLYELKYRKCIYAAELIADIIKEDIEELLKKENIDYILISPISKKRLNERGFNQVSEILKELNLLNKCINIRKIRDTKKMSKFKNVYDRKLNILKAYDVSGLNLNNKSVLIFDDVVTTGSTTYMIKHELEKEYENINILVYAVSVSTKALKK